MTQRHTDEQLIYGLAKTPNNIDCDFAFRCKGNSMTGARIYDGDIVYIKAQPTVNNGEIAAVQVNGKAILKRVYTFADKIILHSENPAYKDKIYNIRDDVKILGRAVAFASMVR